jgi:hypothetical protein
MNFVYLSPDFPPNFVAFPVELARAGVTVLGIGEAPQESFPDALRGALAEYYRVGSLEDYEQVRRAMGYLIHRRGRIDRVESHQEHWLPLEGRLREDFNIPGKRVAGTHVIRRKSVMKERFQAAGVLVAPGEMATDFARGRAFAALARYPLIAKPDAGVGARGVLRIEDDDSLARFFGNRPPEPYFLEAFVEGELLSYDGLCDASGEVVFDNAMVFSSGIHEIVSGNGELTYYTLREIPADLERLGRATAKAFDVREKFFHFEFFRRHLDGALVGIEVNVRPPGGLSTDLFNYANDLDVYALWARMIATGRFEGRATRPFHAAYVGRKDGVPYAHGADDARQRFGDAVRAVARIAGVFRGAIGDEGVVVRAETTAELFPMIRYLLERA